MDTEKELTQAENEETIKLDYTLSTYEERNDLVNKILDSTPPKKLTSRYLTILADYLLQLDNIGTKNKDNIITPNRKTVIDSHETSFEGLVAVFDSEYGENGSSGNEDAIYNLITDNKNIVLTPRLRKISNEDLENVPGLKELVDEINRLEEAFKQASGKAKMSIKKNIIALRKDQYVLRASYKGNINCMNATKSASKLDIYEEIEVCGEDLKVEANISLLIPQHVSALLCNYSALKAECWGKLESDMYWLLVALEDTIDQALYDYPLYFDLMVYKIDGLQNTEIQKLLQNTFGIKYSVEYISSLWRNKIPKLIAEQAQKNYLEYYYTNIKKGNWKRCSRCGQIKLAHTKFFSKNKTSKDGFYSICKDCRNKKVGSVKD